MLIVTCFCAMNLVCAEVSAQKSSEEQPKVMIGLAPNLSEGQSPIYRAGQAVWIQVSMTNTSSEQLSVAIFDRLAQFRPELTRNGEAVSYREGITQLVEAKNKEPAFGAISAPSVYLIEPSATKQTVTLNLNDWYDTLAPGNYQLTMRFLNPYRDGDDLIVSYATAFEVAAK